MSEPESQAVAVIGGGVMGTALAISFHRAGRGVAVCGTPYDEEFIATVEKSGTHPTLGVAVPDAVRLVRAGEWGPVLGGAEIVVAAMASVGFRSMVEEAAPMMRADAVLAIATKGWDQKSAQPLSVVAAEVSPGHPAVIVVGPTLAGELAGGTPTALVCASRDADAARRVADAISSDTVRAFVTDDVAGVEVGAALKNVLAIAIGMCDGIAEAKGGPMINTKAALFSRGLVEMSRLARAMGGREHTVLGLAGAGDLFVTVSGGRNGRFGRLVGLGAEPAKAIEEMGTTVEGYENANEAVALAGRHGLDLPVVEMVYSVLHKGADPGEAVGSLMSGAVESEM